MLSSESYLKCYEHDDGHKAGQVELNGIKGKHCAPVHVHLDPGKAQLTLYFGLAK